MGCWRMWRRYRWGTGSVQLWGTDGTVWIWGARSGQSLEEHPDDPYFRPVQVLDHAVPVREDLAVLENGTLVRFG